MRAIRVGQGVAILTGLASASVVIVGAWLGFQGGEGATTGLLAALAALPPTVFNLITARRRARVAWLRTTLFVDALWGGVAWAGATSGPPTVSPLLFVFALLFLASVISCILRDLARGASHHAGASHAEPGRA